MSDLFTIRKQVSPRARVALAILSWGAILIAWIALTHWEILPPFSLPKPLGVVHAFVRLWTEYDLLGNVAKSWWRIAQAFLWCTVIAIPLGIFMAAFRWLFALVHRPFWVGRDGESRVPVVRDVFLFARGGGRRSQPRGQLTTGDGLYAGCEAAACSVADVPRFVPGHFFFVPYS